jgi:hypothetical protein
LVFRFLFWRYRQPSFQKASIAFCSSVPGSLDRAGVLAAGSGYRRLAQAVEHRCQPGRQFPVRLRDAGDRRRNQ